MGSTRLAGKVMLPIQGRPMLGILLSRLMSVFPPIPIIVATTILPQDDVIAALASSMGVELFRGDEEDVLHRFSSAISSKSSDCIVRVTSDCPLCDPRMLSRALDLYFHLGVDYLSNTIHRTYPRGYDIEIISRQALMTASQHATTHSEKEHVTSYIVRRPYQFSLANFISSENWSAWRLTVDTREDFELVEKIFSALGNETTASGWEEVQKLLRHHPEWRAINAAVVQKNE